MIVYRIIAAATPTERDFLPAKALGKPLRFSRMEREWAEGVSLFATLDHAIGRARAARLRLGTHVVALAIPNDGGIEIRQTGNDQQHLTVYAPSSTLLAFVVGPATDAREVDTHGR